MISIGSIKISTDSIIKYTPLVMILFSLFVSCGSPDLETENTDVHTRELEIKGDENITYDFSDLKLSDFVAITCPQVELKKNPYCSGPGAIKIDTKSIEKKTIKLGRCEITSDFNIFNNYQEPDNPIGVQTNFGYEVIDKVNFSSASLTAYVKANLKIDPNDPSRLPIEVQVDNNKKVKVFYFSFPLTIGDFGGSRMVKRYIVLFRRNKIAGEAKHYLFLHNGYMNNADRIAPAIKGSYTNTNNNDVKGFDIFLGQNGINPSNYLKLATLSNKAGEAQDHFIVAYIDIARQILDTRVNRNSTPCDPSKCYIYVNFLISKEGDFNKETIIPIEFIIIPDCGARQKVVACVDSNCNEKVPLDLLHIPYSRIYDMRKKGLFFGQFDFSHNAFGNRYNNVTNYQTEVSLVTESEGTFPAGDSNYQCKENNWYYCHQIYGAYRSVGNKNLNALKENNATCLKRKCSDTSICSISSSGCLFMSVLHTMNQLHNYVAPDTYKVFLWSKDVGRTFSTPVHYNLCNTARYKKGDVIFDNGVNCGNYTWLDENKMKPGTTVNYTPWNWTCKISDYVQSGKEVTKKRVEDFLKGNKNTFGFSYEDVPKVFDDHYDDYKYHYLRTCYLGGNNCFSGNFSTIVVSISGHFVKVVGEELAFGKTPCPTSNEDCKQCQEDNGCCGKPNGTRKDGLPCNCIEKDKNGNCKSDTQVKGKPCSNNPNLCYKQCYCEFNPSEPVKLYYTFSIFDSGYKNPGINLVSATSRFYNNNLKNWRVFKLSQPGSGAPLLFALAVRHDQELPDFLIIDPLGRRFGRYKGEFYREFSADYYQSNEPTEDVCPPSLEDLTPEERCPDYPAVMKISIEDAIGGEYEVRIVGNEGRERQNYEFNFFGGVWEFLKGMDRPKGTYSDKYIYDDIYKGDEKVIKIRFSPIHDEKNIFNVIKFVVGAFIKIAYDIGDIIKSGIKLSPKSQIAFTIDVRDYKGQVYYQPYVDVEVIDNQNKTIFKTQAYFSDRMYIADIPYGILEQADRIKVITDAGIFIREAKEFKIIEN